MPIAKKAISAKKTARTAAKKPTARPAIIRIRASGAARVVPVKGGLELRIYASAREAVADGVKPAQIKGLFAGHKLYGVCSMLITGDHATVSCWPSAFGCDGNCRVIEDSKVLPEIPGGSGGSGEHDMDPKKVYGCKCTKL